MGHHRLGVAGAQGPWSTSRVTAVTRVTNEHLVVTLEPRHVVGPEGGALQRGHVLGVALEGHLGLGRYFVELRTKGRNNNNYVCYSVTRAVTKISRKFAQYPLSSESHVYLLWLN